MKDRGGHWAWWFGTIEPINQLNKLCEDFYSNLTSHRRQNAAVLQAIAALLWNGLKHYWESINRAFKKDVVRKNPFSSGPPGFWKDCCPTNRLMIRPQRTFASIFFYHIFARSCLIFSCETVESSSSLKASLFLSLNSATYSQGGGGGGGLWWLVTLGPPHVWYKSDYRCGTKTLNMVVFLLLRKVSQYGTGRKTFQTKLWRLQLFEGSSSEAWISHRGSTGGSQRLL